jgi:FkbH-like protein
LFQEAEERLFLLLMEIMRWNLEHTMLSFNTNFMVPQQNPMGKLLQRYDLRNFVYFIEKLNESLTKEIASNYKNAHILDIDQLCSNYGRKYFQDDAIQSLNHGAALNNNMHLRDQDRLEPPAPVGQYYTLRNVEFQNALWAEIVAMYRTIRQVDQVKLVIVDLDDTLWRGIAVEGGVAATIVEGWPLAFVEALLFLKRRGVLLAIASKNDEQQIEKIWNKIWAGRIQLDDFAIRKINWNPKADNVELILSEANLLPRSVVYIDDNPVELAAVKAAFPDIRVLGSDLYYLRRILLWSPETQVPVITAESTKRTEMIQAQTAREAVRKRLSRDEFLASLELRVDILEIKETSHDRFPRAFELLNKTNQFNTTGKRWSQPECNSFFHGGGVFYAFEVEDKFSAYGLVGVVPILHCELLQFVMSCRVIGLGVEAVVFRKIEQRTQESGHMQLTTRIVETDANYICRDLFAKHGFICTEGVWSKHRQ